MTVFSSFDQILLEILNQRKKVTVSLACAHDKELLEMVKCVEEMGLANAILIGDAEKIEQLSLELNLSLSTHRLIDEKDSKLAAREAVKQVRCGNADLLIKGAINSSDFMHAVLDKEEGLNSGNLISHLAAFEVPGFDRLIFVTDGGINIAPGIDEKKSIIQNSLNFLNLIGYENPKAAILSANEIINPKMPVTIEAAILSKMAENGQITGGVVDGPIAMDVALDANAAVQKGINSKVSGYADLLVVPNIEAGNLLGKSIIYFAKARMAGIVLGARAPIILTSRASSKDSKITSIALASLSLKKEFNFK